MNKKTLSITIKVIGLLMFFYLLYLKALNITVNNNILFGGIIVYYASVLIADLILERKSVKIKLIEFSFIIVLFVLGLIFNNFYIRLLLLGAMLFVILLLKERKQAIK